MFSDDGEGEYRQMTEKQRLICMAREKLHTAINHTGDYDDDEISELIEEAIYDILAAAALQGGGDK